MDKVVFTQESIFHLYRLGLIVFSKTGKRYHLQDPVEMNSLIRFADSSNNPVIRRQFEAFLSSVEPGIVETLEIHGLLQPGRYVRRETA